MLNNFGNHKNISSILFPSFPDKNLQISVIIPIKDEELYLNITLDALREQCDVNGNSFPNNLYEVLLLINNSVDSSLKIAKAYQIKYPRFQLHIANIKLSKNIAHVGTVRRLLMNEANRRFKLIQCDGIIASTDGDTEVDNLWLFHTIKEINDGVDVVGGRIISKFAKQTVRRYYLQDVAYRYLAKNLETKTNPALHDPWPSHFQCFGASMAVKCSAYNKAGGLPAIPYLEDAAFCSALIRIDAKIRCSPAVKVYTSSRESNRVSIGFAFHLKHLENMQKKEITQYVESPDILKIKFTGKQRLKEIWQNKSEQSVSKILIADIAQSLFIPAWWLYKEFNKSLFFGELWQETEKRMYISAKWKKTNKQIPITEAIQQLRAYLNH